jgi:hypothetical protein
MLDMMWHLRGSVALDGGVNNAAALDAVERLLEKQRKPVTERGEDFLAFDDSVWRGRFGPGWLAMGIYDGGRFWIEQGPSGRRLCYDLGSLQLFAVCAVVAGVIFGAGLAGGVLSGLKVAALAFGWIYGMNVLIAIARVPRAIRKAVDAPASAGG